MSLTKMFRIGMRLTSRSRQDSAAAPAPEHTSLTRLMSLPTTFKPLRTAAPTMMAVPLVVVEYRDLHPSTQAFDGEAFRRLDVLQVDAAEWLQAGDDVDQPIRIVLKLISMSNTSMPANF